MESNKLYAFWKYDQPPYYLGGEVLKIRDDGGVFVKGYDRHMSTYFTKDAIVAIVPYEDGIGIKKKLDYAATSYDAERNKLRNDMIITVDNLMRYAQSINEKEKGTMYSFDAKKTKDALVQWLRDFFKENGKDCTAVIGISGGKDSSVVAALCVEALGKDRVFGVMMPNGAQSDIDVSIDLIKYLGIDSISVNIHKACKSIKHEIKPQLMDNWSAQAATNLPARIRMATLYAVSQNVNGRVANTCNLSEDWVGYATRYGDGAGDFSPLSNLTVNEVKAIGRELGLPSKFVDKVPTDGLCGKTDEDNLGFTYDELDAYIREGIEPTPEKKAKIDSMHEKNLFKLQLMPSFDPEI